MKRRLRGDAGQVAGIEAVPFGLLVVAVGILVAAHTWAVVDAKFITTLAAREATRAYVEAPAASAGDDAARRAVDRVSARAGRGPGQVHLRRTTTGFGRCLLSEFEATLAVPAVGVPWRPDRRGVEARSRHREVVDPYRDGLDGVAGCRTGP